jgi:glycosyltransferase involved in cell wall biosynthesis
MAKHPRLEIQVAYCTLQGAESFFDSGFGINIVWDIPLLDGYPWIQIKSNSSQPKLGGFLGLFNIDLWRLIAKEKFDAVIVLTGYTHVSFWIALLAAKLTKKKFFFSTDSSKIEPRNKQRIKFWLKKLLLPFIFSLADTVIVSSTLGKQMVSSLGVTEELIALAPFSVDNDWWIYESTLVNVDSVRVHWNIPNKATVLLFCAKLQPWKRPHDVLRAFAKANIKDSYLIFAGDGILKAELETEAELLGIQGKVRFLGFVNQSQLPSIYLSADLFILSSEYEPFGLVVNESMLCGCPVIVSDKVGAGYDLVKHGETGFIYPSGDVDALTIILKDALADRDLLKSMGNMATKRMESWSYEVYIGAIVKALDKLKRDITC